MPLSPRATCILASCVQLGASFGILAMQCWWYCLGWTLGWAATLAWFRYYAKTRVDPVDAFVTYGALWWALLPSMAMLLRRDVRNRRLQRRHSNVVRLSDRRGLPPRERA